MLPVGRDEGVPAQQSQHAQQQRLDDIPDDVLFNGCVALLLSLLSQCPQCPLLSQCPPCSQCSGWERSLRLHLLEELLFDSLRGGDGAHHDLPLGVVGRAVEDVVLDGLPAVVPTGGALPGEVLLTGPEVVGQHPGVRAHAEEDAEAAREFGMLVPCVEVAAIPGLAVENVLLERLGVAGEEGAEPAEGADALLVLLGGAEVKEEVALLDRSDSLLLRRRELPVEGRGRRRWCG